jgi:hypothetical protein
VSSEPLQNFRDLPDAISGLEGEHGYVMNHPQAAITLVIELHGSEDPIEGKLVEPALHAAQFRGWLALTSLIETVRRPTDSVGDEPG